MVLHRLYAMASRCQPDNKLFNVCLQTSQTHSTYELVSGLYPKCTLENRQYYKYQHLKCGINHSAVQKLQGLFIPVPFFVFQQKTCLPPTLYLQLDNCYRDCKNKHILGFCALLVKAGIFRKVGWTFYCCSMPFYVRLKVICY